MSAHGLQIERNLSFAQEQLFVFPTVKCKNVAKRNNFILDLLPTKVANSSVLKNVCKLHNFTLKKNCFATSNTAQAKKAFLSHCNITQNWLGHLKYHAFRDLNVEAGFHGYLRKAQRNQHVNREFKKLRRQLQRN